jgi:membrane protein DedA with SNARE-associated domain
MALLEFLSSLVIWWIVEFGYFGIFLTMVAVSAFLPVPSEVVMPFAGFVVAEGKLGFWQVVLAGSIGNLIGSLAAYWVGISGGRRLLKKYGRYIFLGERELKWAEDWFRRYGSKAIFISRLLPVIRTAISLPAGIARMDLRRFVAYTFLGSVPWCILLTYVGMALGEHWASLQGWFSGLDVLIVIGIVAVAAYWVWRVKKG